MKRKIRQVVVWESIEKSLSNKLGENYKIVSQQPLTGGDINRAYKIDNGEIPFFVKVNDKTHISHFGCEVYSLEKIQEFSEIDSVVRNTAFGFVITLKYDRSCVINV